MVMKIILRRDVIIEQFIIKINDRSRKYVKTLRKSIKASRALDLVYSNKNKYG